MTELHCQNHFDVCDQDKFENLISELVRQPNHEDVCEMEPYVQEYYSIKDINEETVRQVLINHPQSLEIDPSKEILDFMECNGLKESESGLKLLKKIENENNLAKHTNIVLEAIKVIQDHVSSNICIARSIFFMDFKDLSDIIFQNELIKKCHNKSTPGNSIQQIISESLIINKILDMVHNTSTLERKFYEDIIKKREERDKLTDETILYMLDWMREISKDIANTKFNSIEKEKMDKKYQERLGHLESKTNLRRACAGVSLITSPFGAGSLGHICSIIVG